MPADLSELSEKGFDYIALGYEHKASVMQSMHMAYAGSLEPLSVQETGKQQKSRRRSPKGRQKRQKKPFLQSRSSRVFRLIRKRQSAEQ